MKVKGWVVVDDKHIYYMSEVEYLAERYKEKFKKKHKNMLCVKPCTITINDKDIK